MKSVKCALARCCVFSAKSPHFHAQRLVSTSFTKRLPVASTRFTVGLRPGHFNRAESVSICHRLLIVHFSLLRSRKTASKSSSVLEQSTNIFPAGFGLVSHHRKRKPQPT